MKSLKERIEEHNKAIDDFDNVLAEKLNAVDGKVPITAWFKAQELISEQHFYEKGISLVRESRAAGNNSKIDMQSYKITF